MEKMDMEGFLEDVQTSCNLMSMGCADPDCVLTFKSKLQDYALSNRPNILSCYDYANGSGRYTMVNSCDLFGILSKYEEYYDDLTKLIFELLDKGQKINIEQFKIADEKFRTDLYENPKRVGYVEGLKDADCIIALSVFIDKIYDNSVKMMSYTEDPEFCNLKQLHDESTGRFISEFIQKLTNAISTLDEVRRTNRSERAYSANKFLLI